MSNHRFAGEGDFVEFTISEQFEPARIRIGMAMGKTGGKFDIRVNGKLKTTMDCHAMHAAITNPHADLGLCEPLDNSYTIRFEYRGSNPAAAKHKNMSALGVDFFLLEQRTGKTPGG